MYQHMDRAHKRRLSTRPQASPHWRQTSTYVYRPARDQKGRTHHHALMSTVEVRRWGEPQTGPQRNYAVLRREHPSGKIRLVRVVTPKTRALSRQDKATRPRSRKIRNERVLLHSWCHFLPWLGYKAAKSPINTSQRKAVLRKYCWLKQMRCLGHCLLVDLYYRLQNCVAIALALDPAPATARETHADALITDFRPPSGQDMVYAAHSRGSTIRSIAFKKIRSESRTYLRTNEPINACACKKALLFSWQGHHEKCQILVRTWLPV